MNEDEVEATATTPSPDAGPVRQSPFNLTIQELPLKQAPMEAVITRET